jgi:hypothetical protein
MSAAYSGRPAVSSADPGRERLSAQQIGRRLIKNRQPERKGSDGRARAAAAACEDLYRELSRWVGLDGCHALFTRALAEARTESAALDEIQLRPGAEPYIDGVAKSITSRGDAATADALEAMLVHLVELLGRLIGDDMATKLIDRSMAAPARGDTTSDDRREEA